MMIARERIHPNDWNVNAFNAESYPKLVESIREKGMPDTPAGGRSVPQWARRQVANLGLRVCNP